jgi:hypothetical protein
MREYSDGTKIEIDETKKGIRVYNDPESGNFEILGFESLIDIELFINLGDFTPGKDNNFYTIARKKTILRWLPNV